MESEIEILKLLGCILNITGAGGRGLKWVMGSDFFWVCVKMLGLVNWDVLMGEGEEKREDDQDMSVAAMALLWQQLQQGRGRGLGRTWKKIREIGLK